MERTKSRKCSLVLDSWFFCTSVAILCRKLLNSLGVITEASVGRGEEWEWKCQFVVQVAVPWVFLVPHPSVWRTWHLSTFFYFFFILLSTVLNALQKVFREVDHLRTAVLYKSESTHKIIPSVDLCLMPAFPRLNKPPLLWPDICMGKGMVHGLGCTTESTLSFWWWVWF